LEAASASATEDASVDAGVGRWFSAVAIARAPAANS
jgi:hypothetical protein